MLVKPITPSMAISLQNERQHIPDFVVNAFNRLIVANVNPTTGIADIEQSHIVKEILACSGSQYFDSVVTEDRVFLLHWLDIEPLFEEAGWKVHYTNSGAVMRFKFTPAQLP